MSFYKAHTSNFYTKFQQRKRKKAHFVHSFLCVLEWTSPVLSLYNKLTLATGWVNSETIFSSLHQSVYIVGARQCRDRAPHPGDHCEYPPCKCWCEYTSIWYTSSVGWNGFHRGKSKRTATIKRFDAKVGMNFRIIPKSCSMSWARQIQNLKMPPL